MNNTHHEGSWPKATPFRLALLLAFTLPLPVLALETAAPQPVPAAPADAPEAFVLEEVVVTAERRSEKVKDVPVSVSTVSGENLDVLTSGGQDVRLLSARIPSLNIESSFGRAFPRFYIRGYGNTDFRLNASQPVSLVVDDVVQENPILKGFPIFDTDQVEVLRGPQGSLFGRNTPAGVVKFDSVKPQYEQGGYFSVSDGTYNTANVEGAVNMPIGDNFAARLSVLYQHRDDYVDNTFTNEKNEYEGYNDKAARLQFLYTAPDKTFDALLSAHARDLGGTARLFRANIIQPGTNDLVDGFDPDKISIDGQNQQLLTNYGGSLRLRRELGNQLTFYSITGYETLDTYSRGDVDGGYGASFAPPSGPGNIPFSSETADGIPDLDQITQEFRIESSYEGPLNWQAGFFHFNENYKVESFSYDSLNGGAQNGYERVKQTNKAYAVFGALTYKVMPDLTLRGGLRYSWDNKHLKVQEYESSAFGTPATYDDLAAGGPLSADPKDNKLSGDASATYAVNEDVNVYARIANGYRASSIQAAGSFNAQSVAGPETNTSEEVGIKADLLERRAQVAFSVYNFDVKDQQLTAVGGGSNGTRLLNAKKTIGQGAELDFKAILAERLLLTLGGSYNYTRIKDGDLQVAVCAACTVTDPVDPDTGLANINGNPLPQAPKWIGNFTLRYGIPVGNGEVFAYTDWSYRSKVDFFLYESTEFTSKDLVEGGLRMGYLWGQGQYELAAYARNITDTTKVTGAIDFNNLTGFINEPRIFGLQFKATY